MTCKACEEATANPWCGAYRADCDECSARALSHSPAHFESERAGKITQRYLDALQVIFGKAWKDGHARVKVWAARRKT